MGRVLRRRLIRPGKKRGDGVGKTKKSKGTKWMLVADGHGTPLGCHLGSATPAEVKLVERTLDRGGRQAPEGMGRRPGPG